MSLTTAKDFADQLGMSSLKDMARTAAQGSQFRRLVNEAIEIKDGRRRVDSGQLIAIEEPPSRENGGRYITRFEGDIMSWMRPMMTQGSVCRIDYELVSGAKAGRFADQPRSNGK
jgi:hypothetical protein